MYPLFCIDVFLLGQESIASRVSYCKQTKELVAFGSGNDFLYLLGLIAHRNVERGTQSFISIFCCLGKASANIAILSLSPDSSTSATSFLNAAMFFANGAMTLAIFSCPRTTTNSNCRKWSLVGALNAALIIHFKASSLTSRPEKSRYVRRFSNTS